MSESKSNPTEVVRRVYWRTNLRYVSILLSIWFAQQGSIYVFVALIFIYVRLMNRLEKRLGMSED